MGSADNLRRVKNALDAILPVAGRLAAVEIKKGGIGRHEMSLLVRLLRAAADQLEETL